MVKQRYKVYGDTYYLIMLDYSMPVCGGIEAGKKIRSFVKKYLYKNKHPTICCITSYQGDSHKREAKNVGMDYFLVKPVLKTGLQKLLKLSGIV